VPAVVLVTASFEAGARAAAQARGLSDLPIGVFPADLDQRDSEAVAARFALQWPEIWAGWQPR
jgi:hypothetical protein